MGVFAVIGAVVLGLAVLGGIVKAAMVCGRAFGRGFSRGRQKWHQENERQESADHGVV